jgi:hypothetical protein
MKYRYEGVFKLPRQLHDILVLWKGARIGISSEKSIKQRGPGKLDGSFTTFLESLEDLAIFGIIFGGKW